MGVGQIVNKFFETGELDRQALRKIIEAKLSEEDMGLQERIGTLIDKLSEMEECEKCEEMIEDLKELLDKVESGEVSEEEAQEIVSEIENALEEV